MKYKIKILACLLFISGSIFAQTEGHHEMMKDSTSHGNHQNMEMHDMEDMQHSVDVPMSHGFSLNLPMNRNSSGTGWLPDNAPMNGYMLHTKKWMYMIHGNIFLSYNHQDIGNVGTRGDEKFYSPNWVMGMGQTKVGERGLFRFSVMLSLDPMTIGGAIMRNIRPRQVADSHLWKSRHESILPWKRILLKLPRLV